MSDFEAQIELKHLVLVLELMNMIFKDSLAKKPDFTRHGQFQG